MKGSIEGGSCTVCILNFVGEAVVVFVSDTERRESNFIVFEGETDVGEDTDADGWAYAIGWPFEFEEEEERKGLVFSVISPSVGISVALEMFSLFLCLGCLMSVCQLYASFLGGVIYKKRTPECCKGQVRMYEQR